jgi:hypothetical protein
MSMHDDPPGRSGAKPCDQALLREFAAYCRAHDRRMFMRGATSVVASTALVACGNEWGLSERETGPFFSGRRGHVMNMLCDIIIPQTDTPGALAAGVPRLLEGFMSNWAGPASRDAARQSWEEIDKRLSVLAGQDITGAAREGQIAAVARIDAETFGNERVANLPWQIAYREQKVLIARTYYLTEAGATLELRHDDVPGEWHACTPLRPEDRTWAVES